MRDRARPPRSRVSAGRHGPREVTLQQRPHNLFRFVADNGQGVAGLATYVFRELGWRHAAIVIGHWPSGWLERDAFAAEFCALGGRVTDQIGMFEAGARDASQFPGTSTESPSSPGSSTTMLRSSRGSRRGSTTQHASSSWVPESSMRRKCCAPPRLRWQGSYRPRRWTRFECAITCGGMRGPPRRSAGTARSEAVTGYRDAVEALMQALERAGGATDRLR